VRHVASRMHYWGSHADSAVLPREIGDKMIDSFLNLIFRCRHKRLTRPITPVRNGVPRAPSYVACLECGKQFSYDTREMQIGKPLSESSGESLKRGKLWGSRFGIGRPRQ